MSIEPSNYRNGNKVIASIVWIAVLLTTLIIFVPFLPKMPGSGLDDSWTFAINQAVAQKLAFGKQMIFTYGPYASVYTHSYHPGTDNLMLGASLYLALTYLFYFALLMPGIRLRWLMLYFFMLIVLKKSPDVLLFSFPLIAGLDSFKLMNHENHTEIIQRYSPLIVLLLFAPLGLLPLIKGSTLILCSLVTGICVLLFLARHERFLATICAISPLVSAAFFWVSAGQSLKNLPGYFFSMLQIINGYTEAMAIEHDSEKIMIYLAATIFILLMIYLQKQFSIFARLYLLALYSAFLFVAFKSGFVRSDSLHILIAANSLTLSAVLLAMFCKSKILIPVMIFALLSGWHINNYRSSMMMIGNNIALQYSQAWFGIMNRINDTGWARKIYDRRLANLKKESSFPELSGTADIYSHGQSYLIASKYLWVPRPILHSYSSYTPGLIETNRQHLLSDKAPENVIFKLQALDEKIPAIEDGSSWPVLLLNYKPFDLVNGFLFLRKHGEKNRDPDLRHLQTTVAKMGEAVYPPQSPTPVFANFFIEQTYWGRVINMLFKPDKLQINLKLKNGEVRHYRFAAKMSESGFIISPLIENTVELKKLYESPQELEGKKVESFSISTHSGTNSDWESKYTVGFSKVETDL